ncbi:sigma-54 dependent transcriptional regulator [Neptuniibacter sp. UBA6509]|uniref:sigma-54-dependent transcriptional regulator n=3 Tax=unclassified Neptuniibacter TaxID=2630693 RepID=UPI000C6ACD93|nr:sigma-54 dependent transcriptional regulator [Neptuniibacter sp. UBA6509]MAY41056.1 sigma-54-dependent Fis family transcriptional regulator [Oceanospirillaceae bacterium]|tara:strand:+ start:45510 stop:46898 length:1389 start_codon:yes stop_codon:yes gene_type:complete
METNQTKHQMPAASVLVVDDEPGILSFLQKALSKRFALVETAGSVEEAEKLRARCHFDLLIVDIKLPGRSGMEWHEALQNSERRSDVIFMTAYADLETAIQAIRLGAADFILKPFRLEQMMNAVERCLEHRALARANFVLRREVNNAFPSSNMIGNSPAIQQVQDVIRRVAKTPSAILIEGESGTGKELAARMLHQLSNRSGPFVPINCGAIAPELLEAELFGHTKGAFTGANKAREGLFNFASGGTLFLDEVGEMPLLMQAKLLRALEQKAVRPVGSEQETSVDVRIIAATNRHLKEEVSQNRFREDLFYRLNVLSITLPPLRDRREDLPELIHHFSAKLSRELSLSPIPFSHDDLKAMQSYHWAGNIRELKNLIERCILLGKLPADYFKEQSDNEKNSCNNFSGWSLEALEKHHILLTLDQHQGNKSSAARELGVSRKTLDRKLSSWAEQSQAITDEQCA